MAVRKSGVRVTGTKYTPGTNKEVDAQLREILSAARIGGSFEVQVMVGDSPLLVAAFLMVTLGAVVYIGIRCRCVPQTMLAFLLQGGIAVLTIMISGIREDARVHHEMAIQVSLMIRDGSAGTLEGLTAGKQSLVWLLGAIYALVGVSPLAGIITSALFASTLPALIATATQNFGLGRRASLVASWAAVFAPQLLYWGPGIRRESLSFFLLSLGVLGFSLVFSGRFSKGAVVAALASLGIFVTRPQLGLSVAVGLALSGWLARRGSWIAGAPRASPWSLMGVVGVSALSALASILLLLSPAWDLGSISRWQEIRYLNVSPENTLSVLASDESASRFDVNTTPAELLFPEEPISSADRSQLYASANYGLGSIASIPNALWGPFPWEWRSAPWVLVGLDGLFMLGAWILLAFGLIACRRIRPTTIILLAACLPIILGDILLFANFGITARVRAHYLVMLIPVLAASVVSLVDSVQVRKFASLRK